MPGSVGMVTQRRRAVLDHAGCGIWQGENFPASQLRQLKSDTHGTVAGKRERLSEIGVLPSMSGQIGTDGVVRCLGFMFASSDIPVEEFITCG